MRWTSRCRRGALRTDSTTGGPMARLGTKWGSMTSTWSMVAPARSTRAMSSARRAKSADRIDGTISIICGLVRFYHSGIESVPGIAAGNAAHGLDDEFPWNGGDHGFILFRLERTGGIHQQATGREGRARIGEQRGLAAMEILEMGGREPPLDFGVAAEGAGAGARNVEEDAVEWAREGKRLGGVEDHQVGGEADHGREAARMEIAGHGMDARFERLRGLVAGRGAEIEEPLAGGEAEQRDDGLRADVLDAAAAHVLFRLLERGAGDGGGGLGAVVASPSSQQPLGAGEFHVAAGPFDGGAIHLPQHGIDEARGGALARALDQFHAAGHGGVRRDALQIPTLIDAHAQRDAHFGVELPRAAGVMPNQPVELRAVSQHPEDDGGGEAGVPGIEGGGVGEKQIGGVAAGFHLAEDVEGGGAGGGQCPASTRSCFPMMTAAICFAMSRSRSGRRERACSSPVLAYCIAGARNSMRTRMSSGSFLSAASSSNAAVSRVYSFPAVVIASILASRRSSMDVSAGSNSCRRPIPCAASSDCPPAKRVPMSPPNATYTDTELARSPRHSSKRPTASPGLLSSNKAAAEPARPKALRSNESPGTSAAAWKSDRALLGSRPTT